MNGWSAAATFPGEFSDVTHSYAEGRAAISLVTVTFRYWPQVK
jgi:hypothetical protein